MAHLVEPGSSQRVEQGPDLSARGTRAPGRIHWSTWSAALLGIGQILLSVTVLAAEPSARLAMLVAGALLLLSTAYAVITPGLRTEYVHMVLGLVLVGAPVVCGFTGSGAPATWCWALGGATVLVGLAALPPPPEAGQPETGQPETGQPVAGPPAGGPETAAEPWPTRVGELTAVTDQEAGRHHAVTESHRSSVREEPPAGGAGRAAAEATAGKSASPRQSCAQRRKLDPQQVERIRALSEETDDDGKRRHTVAHLAAEFGVARSTIYRRLNSPS